MLYQWTCSGALPKTVFWWEPEGLTIENDHCCLLCVHTEVIYLQHTPIAIATEETRRLWSLIKASTNWSRVFRVKPLKEVLFFCYLSPSLSFKCAPLQFIESHLNLPFLDSLRENSIYFSKLNLILLFLSICLFLGGKTWLEFLCVWLIKPLEKRDNEAETSRDSKTLQHR